MVKAIWSFFAGVPKEVWYTILGGFISGLIGIMLFIFQRSKQKKDEQQNTLFRLYKLSRVAPLDRGLFGNDEVDLYQFGQEKWREMLALSVLIKGKLGREIFACLNEVLPDKKKVAQVFKRIELKLNKKLFREIHGDKYFTKKMLKKYKKELLNGTLESKKAVAKDDKKTPSA